MSNDRGEVATQRAFLLQTSGFRGRLVAGNNHADHASCSGALRRAAGALARLPALLQRHAADAVLEVPWPDDSRNILGWSLTFMHLNPKTSYSSHSSSSVGEVQGALSLDQYPDIVVLRFFSFDRTAD